VFKLSNTETINKILQTHHLIIILVPSFKILNLNILYNVQNTTLSFKSLKLRGKKGWVLYKKNPLAHTDAKTHLQTPKLNYFKTLHS